MINTLREMGIFVGMSPPISLRAIGSYVTSPVEPISMRFVIQRLQGLPPISLEAEAVGARFGDVPFAPVFHVRPSNGVILETRMTLLPNGPQREETAKVGDSGNFSPLTLRFPGIFLLQVSRTGIQNTGITTLRLSFHVEGVEPPPVSPPPPSQTRPSISVQRSGPADAVKFVVTGTGFLPNQPASYEGITVRVVDGVNFQDWVMLFTGSDSGGGIRLETNPLDTRLLARNSLGLATVHFSATDKRRDPTSVPANEPLWSNVVSFSF